MFDLGLSPIISPEFRKWSLAPFVLLFTVVLLSAITPANAALISARSSTSQGRASAAAGPFTLNKPAGTTVGDVMIASIGYRPCSSSSGGGCTTSITPPAGWTLIRLVEQTTGGGTGGYGLRLGIYRRVVTAGDNAVTSYTWTIGGAPSHNGAAGVLSTFINVDTANPIVIDGGQATPSSRTHTTPDIGPLATNTLLVSTHAALSSATWSPPAGMTEILDWKSEAAISDLGMSLEINNEQRPMPGLTGTRTATFSNPPATDAGATHILALRPIQADPTIIMARSGNLIVGSTASYALTIGNNGPNAIGAANITVTNTLPAGLTYTSRSGTGWTCGAVGQVVTCTYSGASLPGGSTLPVLTLNVNVVSGSLWTNTASVSSGADGDNDLTNSTATDTWPTATTTLATGTDPAATIIGPSALATDVDRFTLKTSNATEPISSVTVNLSDNTGIDTLSITDNSNNVLGSVAFPASSGSITIPVINMTATTTLQTFKVRVTPLVHVSMPVPPGATYTVTAPVTAWTGPAAHVGSDTNPNALTIDNLSPNAATATSATPGTQKTTLKWTTSSSSDFNTTSGSVVFRWLGATVGSEVPIEGSTPLLNQSNGTATVACVSTSAASTALTRIDGSGGSADCSGTALVSGQQYAYKVFQKDNLGNYDVGNAFPNLSIADGTLTEGNSGQTNMSFTVTQSNAGSSVTTASYTLTNGAATGGASCATAGVDYINTGGTVTVSAGATTGTINVPICGDTTYEGDESFTVTLSNPVNAVLGVPTTATGTILNDDAPPLVAEYRFDETTWNGTTGEVKDSSGNGYNATAALAVTASGSPGPAYSAAGQSTCRFGVFDGGSISKSYVQMPNSFPGLSGSFSLTAWINSTNASAQHQRIFVRDDNDNGWALSLADGTGTPVLRFFNRNVSFNSPIDGVISAGGVAIDTAFNLSSNTWYFVGLTVDTVGKTVVMYVYDANGVQHAKMSASFTGTWGAGTGATAIGGETSASAEGQQTSWHFLGRLDEVRVYSGALTQSLVQALLSTTRLCSFRDHYELSLPTNSITCLGSTATVTACADNSSPCTNKDPSASGQTATLSTSGGALAATTVTFDATGVASTTLSYPAAADGDSATVTLSGEQVAALNPRQCCPNGTSCVAADSCSTTFNTAGFVFSSAANSVTSIPTQVAGTSAGTYYLRAVKTSDNSAHTCGAALSGAQTVNLAYECNNPTSCYGSNLLSVNGGTATTIQRNNNSGPYTYTLVDMTFDASGNAPFTFIYSDVGQIGLKAQKTLTADNTKTPPIAAATLTGSSNPFVVKPAGFKLTAIKQTASPNLANPAAANATGAKFVKAGEAFSATVTALTSTGSTAFNYGQENLHKPAPDNVPEGVKLTSVLANDGNSPETHFGMTNNPTLTNNAAFGTFSNGVATGTTFGWDEVGIITLVPSVKSGNYLATLDTTLDPQCDPALPGSYGGATACPPSGNVGRFYAAQFALTNSAVRNRAEIVNTANTGSISIVAPSTLTLSSSAGIQIGNRLTIVGAGVAGAALSTTATDVSADGLTITLANAASIAVSNAPVYIGNFTYMGEPMNALFTLTAQAAGGLTLQNYNYSATAANNFAKLNPMAAVVAGSGGPLGMGAVNNATPRTPFPPCGTTPAHPCLTPQQATAGTFVAGVANNVTVPFSLYRGNAPVGSYAALDVGIAPQDSDGAILVYDLDTVNVTAGTANHTKVGSTAARFGRLKLSNAFGSEKSSLQIPVQVQYWSGSSWVLNSDDVATALTAASVGLSGYVGPSVAPLSSTNLGPGHVSGFVADGGGKWKLTLTKPDPAATGSVTVCVDLGADPVSGGVVCSATSAAMPWLQARWPPGASYDNDPYARATFGIYSPETRKTIHVRELY